MKKLPTKTAEEVYAVLMKFAEASAHHYDRETFVYHYGVFKNMKPSFKLRCFDKKERIFTCTPTGEMSLSGPNSEKVNPILKKFTEDLKVIA